jgi:hypothetical protein
MRPQAEIIRQILVRNFPEGSFLGKRRPPDLPQKTLIICIKGFGGRGLADEFSLKTANHDPAPLLKRFLIDFSLLKHDHSRLNSGIVKWDDVPFRNAVFYATLRPRPIGIRI